MAAENSNSIPITFNKKKGLCVSVYIDCRIENRILNQSHTYFII